jgi:hypothetical protein
MEPISRVNSSSGLRGQAVADTSCAHAPSSLSPDCQGFVRRASVCGSVGFRRAGFLLFAGAAPLERALGAPFPHGLLLFGRGPLSVAAGALPPGIVLDSSSGVISGTPTASGTYRAGIRASSQGGDAATRLLLTVLPDPAGPSADRPVFQSEGHGAFSQPWGAAGFAWPQQLFWNGNSFIDQHYYDMLLAADGCENVGLTPVLGCVALGYEYTACTGGDSANGIADMSGEDGWGEFGRWMSAPEHAKYRSTNWNGETERVT